MLTKNDMARVLIQSLFHLKDLPASDDPRVVRKAKMIKPQLEPFYRMAHKQLLTQITTDARDAA